MCSQPRLGPSGLVDIQTDEIVSDCGELGRVQHTAGDRCASVGRATKRWIFAKHVHRTENVIAKQRLPGSPAHWRSPDDATGRILVVPEPGQLSAGQRFVVAGRPSVPVDRYRQRGTGSEPRIRATGQLQLPAAAQRPGVRSANRRRVSRVPHALRARPEQQFRRRPAQRRLQHGRPVRAVRLQARLSAGKAQAEGQARRVRLRVFRVDHQRVRCRQRRRHVEILEKTQCPQNRRPIADRRSVAPRRSGAVEIQRRLEPGKPGQIEADGRTIFQYATKKSL